MSSYVDEITLWQQKRESELRDPDGWLTLAGLFWLEEGRNTFGADPANALLFPETAAQRMGEFLVTEEGVEVVIAPGVVVTCGDEPITRMTLSGPEMEGPVLAYGSLRWFIIRRDGRWAVRLRDREHPALAAFPGVEYFPIDPSWRVPARLVAHSTPVTVPLPTILGTVNQTPSPGLLHFVVQGVEHTLIALNQGKSALSLIFADATSGKESYGSGRFLTVEAADSQGHTTIDFNRAYNPPCAFTPFATCPLPPAGNRLPFPIAAGEKKYGDH
ncbi:MAG: DUF1684 domain-containing protein [Caldilineaceae bacterium]|nr:DUF1684 domain-containing protein [Caldilineaceae bacterium]HRJ45592.1 DUF1684 domain-containing protein [Caldilineaceae bacterium]